MSAVESNSPVIRDREAAGDATMYYTLWTIFKRDSDLDRTEGVEAFDALVAELAADAASGLGAWFLAGRCARLLIWPLADVCGGGGHQATSAGRTWMSEGFAVTQTLLPFPAGGPLRRETRASMAGPPSSSIR